MAAERDAILANPGFGLHFTDHMVEITWDKAQGWHDAQVRAYGPLSLDPAAATEVCSGLSTRAFRPAGRPAYMLSIIT